MIPMQGRFVWYELLTTDSAAAGTFYRSVVGWSAQDAGMPGMSYTILSAGPAPVAGLMDLSQTECGPDVPPHWFGYVGVDDVDAAAAQVVRDGGAVHRAPADIPEVGRFAIVADPQGAAFALFKGIGEAPPSAAPGTPGLVGWHELYAVDGAAAFDFYAGVFGWTKAEALDMGPMGVYQLFAVGGDTIGGVMTKPEDIPYPFWRYYIIVDDIDAAVSRVEAGGGQVLHGPHQVPGGSWIIHGRDPQGAMFALVGPRA